LAVRENRVRHGKNLDKLKWSGPGSNRRHMDFQIDFYRFRQKPKTLFFIGFYRTKRASSIAIVALNNGSF
jgi:hypothetical protein